jgi:Domain of unknown function (DUF4157)
MTTRVIQGSFLGRQPKLAMLPQPTVTPPPPIQTKTTARSSGPPTPAFARHPLDPSSPAFARQPGAVQRHGADGSFPVDPGRLGLVSSVGKPLPDEVRAHMELAFGADFSRVRVHTGPQAERIGAIAFTTGNDIYFAPGRFQPNTVQGKLLIGHELAHVVQQRQGRVRNAQGVRVAVVQDRALEAEADRMARHVATQRVGTRVRMPQGALQRSAALHSSAQITSHSDKSHSGAAGSKPNTIQRTIWRFDGRRWRTAELGTKGRFKKPDDGAKGEYFNDVNNQRGKNINDVRAGLSDVMMITGSLTDKKMDLPWPKQLWKDLLKIELPVGGDIIVLGTVTLEFGQPIKFFPLTAKYYRPLQDVWFLLLSDFMRKNGQLPYIERQRWFTEREAKIEIDINFYPERGSNAELSFHKDTAGDNLFVNLIFNNDKEMLATEWIEDLLDPLKIKRLEMEKLLPPGMIAEIKAAREAMLAGHHAIEGAGTIRGGIAGSAAFVSWVDELAWHATPSAKRRRFVKTKPTMYDLLLDPWDYWAGNKVAIHGALLYLSKLPETWIGGAEWRKYRKENFEGFSTDFVDDYMETVVPQNSVTDDGTEATWTGAKGSNYDRHIEDVKKNALKLQRAPISLQIGQELAPDPGGIGTLEFNKRTGIRSKSKGDKRRTQRANSVIVRGRNTEVKFADLLRAAANYPKRSFLRTWVRIHRLDLSERKLA